MEVVATFVETCVDFDCLYEAAVKLAITLVRRLLNRGILYASWQSYTYCNCDKIVTFFTGRTTDSSVQLLSTLILTIRNSWQSSPTVVVYVRHLTVHNNVCIMHSTYTANLRSSFERLIPSGGHGPSLFRSTAECRC